MGTTTQALTARPSEILGAVAEGSLSNISRGFALRGVGAVAYGMALLIWPGPTVAVMFTLFGFYAIADGAVALWTSAKAAPGERWPSAIQGFASVSAGLIGFIWPGITALALLYVIGSWAVFKGIVEMTTAITRPDLVEHPVLLGLAGLLAIGFGVAVWVHPGAGALAVVTLMAVVAISVGVTFIGVSLRAHRAKDDLHQRFA